MSRFDDELIKQAENAYELRVGPGAVQTPRQIPHIQNVQPYADALVPAETGISNQMNLTSADRPVTRMLDVRDLDAADPAGGKPGEIVGMPGMSNVYALGGPDPVIQPGALVPSTGFGGDIAGLPQGSLGVLPKAASINPIDESLYQVYKASREVRDAIASEIDFDFGNLITASNEASTVMRFASADNEINQIIGTVANIVLDIENDLIETGDFKQASADLESLEGLLDDVNKYAKKKNCTSCKGEGCDECKDEEGTTAAKKKKKGMPPWLKKKGDDDEDDDDEDEDDECSNCHGKGCDKCKKSKSKKKKKASAYYATNGNQETGVTIDVRDLDDQAGLFSRLKVMTPDFTTNPLDAEEINAEDAGYVKFYNDGSSTGIIPGQEPHKTEVFPMDGTNPAYVPYQNALGAVQASRERIFDSLQVVERLEKLGMVSSDDRAKHLAKFEQMSDSKLAGFKASLDMLEESGARQPRSQKLASGSSRLPEMGRLTTASTVSRQQLSADDWLMTL